MIFRQRFLEGIRDGSITLAFRRWRRPSVRAGGTLLTAVGQLEIVSVDEVATTRISHSEARRAGYASRDDLLTELSGRTEGTVYRVALVFCGRIRASRCASRRRSPMPSGARFRGGCNGSTPAPLTVRGRAERSKSSATIPAVVPRI